ncbi:LysM peptidoglycan-binding domain-containing protein [Mycolicibacterium xanthum]|uniref:LysM peptidoglycan-binding domain-containing protein n=1 Tax=Mycolicibacterium xanthum TaxID=2796469 RepID=UPI002102FC8B|nr:LysM peptidoglycan-binding domain-containing protein [Mycolicibacterium xanthum]
MTIMHMRETWETSGEFGPDSDQEFRAGSGPGFRHALPREIPPARPNRASASRRPKSRRPAGAAVRYRGTGVRMSRAPHRRSRITPGTTVLLALLAGVITVWLGLVAQAGGVVGEHVETPSRLAVVQVQAGESLQQVAERVAPGVPVTHVVDQIRELNKLESAVLDAGQSLIAPVR